MTTWHRDEAEQSCLHHAAVDAKSSDKGKAGGTGGGGATVQMQLWTNAKRNGRSCGKVPVRLLSGTCGTTIIIAISSSITMIPYSEW